MKKLFTALFLWIAMATPSQAQDNRDVILQAFYWNTFPGNYTDTVNGGVWWDSLAIRAQDLADKGFKTIYGPPPTKAVEGIKDCGFAMTDYYDFGNFSSTHSPGYGLPATTTRTRYGNKTQMQSAITAIHNSGMKFMMDIILNHRGGGSTGTYECRPGGMDNATWDWLHSGGRNNFNFSSTPSGRVAVNNAQYYHPNNQTCDISDPLHYPFWSPDISQLSYPNTTLISGAPSNGWYHGSSNLSGMADSLIIWGRYLHQNLGIDEFRMDAAKHMEAEFTAAWAVELLNNGSADNPYIAMENADGNTQIRDYLNSVHSINTTKGKTKNAKMAAFDFNMKGTMEDLSEGYGSFDMANLNRSYGRGLYNIGVAKERIVTFVQNHDHDRGGFRTCGASEPSGCGTRQVTHAGQCLEYYCALAPEYSPGHNAVDGNKHLPYAYILTAPGRPTIFWKDYYWYGFNDDIDYLMALRRTMIKSTDEACSMNELNPGGGSYDTHSLNMMYRGANCTGSSSNPSGILVLNDHGGGTEQSAYVDTYFANKELKDYSDYYPFETTQTFDDGGKWRALLKAKGTNYAFWAPTGRYPTAPGTPASKFTMTAAEGGKVHWVVLRAANAASYLVGGSPIQVGDEVAVVGKGGTGIAGIGRIGQTFKWNGTHDMIIEVLGDASGTAGGRLATNDVITLQVKRDNLTWNLVVPTWENNSVSFTANLSRPSTRPTGVSYTTNNNTSKKDANGQWLNGGRSVLLSFSTSGAPLAINVTNFIAQQQGSNAAQLSWNIENQGGVYVEHKAENGEFEEIAFLEKGENTFTAQNLKAGTHTFRLKTVKDNVTDYSTEKTLSIEIPTDFEISQVYPNPFAQEAQFDFTVATEQHVKITVHDALGREIVSIFDGAMKAQESTTFAINGASLSNGTYFLRFQGETFQKSQAFTILK